MLAEIDITKYQQDSANWLKGKEYSLACAKHRAAEALVKLRQEQAIIALHELEISNGLSINDNQHRA